MVMMPTFLSGTFKMCTGDKLVVVTSVQGNSNRNKYDFACPFLLSKSCSKHQTDEFMIVTISVAGACLRNDECCEDLRE